MFVENVFVGWWFGEVREIAVDCVGPVDKDGKGKDPEKEAEEDAEEDLADRRGVGDLRGVVVDV